MSEAIDNRTWRRLRNTPLRDLLRFRVSGRLDWRRVIDEAPITGELKAVVYDVVRRTRLWRSEKASVARELISHFADATDAGVSVPRAIERFGDAKSAARLIRRAKIRNRSYAWHAFRLLRRVTAALIAFYLGAAIYYHTGEANVSVDYVAKLNEPILATPQSDWSWPILQTLVPVMDQSPHPDARWPGEAGWKDSVAWLERHASDVETIRRGAAKPAFGAPLRAGVEGSQSPPLVGAVVTIALPQLNHFRRFAYILAMDAGRAVEMKDAERLKRDLDAIFNLSDQLRRRDFLITDLVSLSIRTVGLNTLMRVLEHDPSLLSDASMVEYAHRFSLIRRADDLITYRGERYFFYDLVQRMYTDDGNGDGRLAPEAADVFRELQSAMTLQANQGTRDWYEAPAALALGPAAMLVTASRKDLLYEYDAYMDACEARLSQNLRDLRDADAEKRIVELKSSPLLSVRYAMVATVAPALNRTQVSAERALGMQEGAQVVIALELYKRRTGAYPDTLNALVPTLLPRIPADRIDGAPLRYRLIDGKPIVYSVGADRDDDAGKMPMHDGEPVPTLAAQWNERKPVDADWVLFPAR